MLKVKEIITELQSEETEENLQIDELDALSKIVIAYFEGIANNLEEPLFNRKLAWDAIAKEYAFLEIYARRRITENRILDIIEDVYQAVTLLTNEISALSAKQQENKTK